MSEQDNEQPAESRPTVTLSLGQLALDPSELVLLREGDTIELPCAFPLTGALTLSGTPWAYVTINKSDQGLAVEVTKLVALP